MHTAKLAGKTPAITGAALAALLLLPSCVHEWPEADGLERDVKLHIHHKLEWNPHLEMTVTRADGQDHKARYHFKLCPAGDKSRVITEMEYFSEDLSRADFYTTLSLPPGSYDLWTWSDWADYDSGKSLFFDSSDFTSINYPEPYSGNDDRRDALRGMTTFSIDNTLDDSYRKDVYLDLERPLAKYEFISTDLAEFIDNEITRGEQIKAARGETRSSDSDTRGVELDKYRVKMVYSGYMPSEFDNFQNKPVNSRTGMSYDAEITSLNDNEAMLGFDYVMVNGHESSIPVRMEIYDPEGVMIGKTNPIEVPTQRNRLTIVRGKFLTSKATGGVGINPDFDGDFNIEIK